MERFLRAASTWADVIVVLDQASEDGSAEIARSFDKVHVADYPHPTYDDPIRRGLLVDLARQLVPGPRVLVALDADEFMAADAWEQPEMRAFLAAPPGTLALMRWINLLPDEPRAWIPGDWTDFMLVDDGSAFRGEAMHGPRLPAGPRSERVHLDEPKVIHLQYLDWNRMRAKQRWYQAQERIEYPRKRPIQIYRQYHHMDAISERARHPVRPEWLAGYGPELAESLLTVQAETAYPTDNRVLDLLAAHSPGCFRRIELWDGDWGARAQALGRPVPAAAIADPRRT